MAPKKRSPPAEKSRQEAARPPFRPRSRSPPPRRVTGKGPEEVAPAARPDAVVENGSVSGAAVAPKSEVKVETVQDVPAAPAPALPDAEPAGSQGKAYEAPPTGELQRMVSNLKIQAKNGNAAPLTKYQSFTDIQEKRKYYYECWLTANPKTTDSGAVRTRKSEKVDEAVAKDHGWVDLEYVAEKLCLKDWKTSEETNIKLQFQLSQLERRPHPAQALLKEGMDRFQYHYVEKKDKETQRNKRGFELLQQTALTQEEHGEALSTWDAGAASSNPLPAPGHKTPKTTRTPSRSPTNEPAPEWLSSFKKEAVNNLAGVRRSMTVLLGNAETLVKNCDDHKTLFQDSQLLQAYLETVRVQIRSLKDAQQKAATFELKHSKLPQSSQEAQTLLAKFKAATEAAKAVKNAFSSSTSAMQAALRSKLAQLTGSE